MDKNATALPLWDKLLHNRCTTREFLHFEQFSHVKRGFIVAINKQMLIFD